MFQEVAIFFCLILMSSILHFENVLISPCPILHGYSAHTCVCVFLIVRCGSVSSYRDGSSLGFVKPGLFTEKHSRTGVYIPSQSTAGPGIVSVHKRHHHKHSQSRHVDAPVGILLWLKNIMAIAFEKRENEEDFSFSTSRIPPSLVPSFFGSPRTRKKVSAV